MEIEIKHTTKGRGVLRGVSTAASVLATLVGVALIVPSMLGLQRFAITGTSMTGTIDYGSLTFEKVVPVSDLRVGDVITYQPPPGAPVDTLVTHRIIAIHGHTFRTQGDAVPQPDPWKFQLDQAEQARVAFTVPYLGYPFIWLADRQTRILVISVPAGLVTLASLAQFLQALRRRPKSPAAPVPAGPSS